MTHNVGKNERIRHKQYTLLGADGRPYLSDRPGTLGGNRRAKIYGRLDCPAALRERCARAGTGSAGSSSATRQRQLPPDTGRAAPASGKYVAWKAARRRRRRNREDNR